MNALRCEDCSTLWLAAPPEERVPVASGEGCLRCNGALRAATPDEVAERLGPGVLADEG